MKLVIIHGGQTGVDRGAHLGAVDAKLELRGFAPSDCKDECGQIPNEVMRNLGVSIQDGYRARTVDNVRLSQAVLIICEHAGNPYATRGTALTISVARRLHVPFLCIGGDVFTDAFRGHDMAISKVRAWITNLEPLENASLRLMVAGPRASTWPQGEAFARSLVGGLVNL